MAPAE